MNRRFEQGYALIIGVGGDLPNTVDDAAGIATILCDPARCAYPPDHVYLLTNGQATRSAILDHLDTLAHSADEGATAIVYFSGHGCRVDSPTGSSYHLIPAGYNLNDLDATTISGMEFTTKLRQIRTRRLLVLLDCCHAGGIGSAKGSALALAKAALPLEAETLLKQGAGRIVIASSRDDEFSFAGVPYSAFTLAVLEAFCGIGASQRDGYVRVADLAMHARERVPARSKGQQHPVLHFEHADNFVLAYYGGGDTRPKGLPFDEQPQIEPAPGAWTRTTVPIPRGIDIDGRGVILGGLASRPGSGLDYVSALEQFKTLLGEHAPGLVDDFRVYEHRLRENLQRERFGSTEALRAERAEIVDGLNGLARRAGLSIVFNDLLT